MPEYSLITLASKDLAEIARYTERRWGLTQAYRYIAGLREIFQVVAANPKLSRTCGSVSPRYRRIEKGRHVVFYQLDRDGVLIGRILHQRMLPGLRVFEDS